MEFIRHHFRKKLFGGAVECKGMLELGRDELPLSVHLAPTNDPALQDAISNYYIFRQTRNYAAPLRKRSVSLCNVNRNRLAEFEVPISYGGVKSKGIERFRRKLLKKYPSIVFVKGRPGQLDKSLADVRAQLPERARPAFVSMNYAEAYLPTVMINYGCNFEVHSASGARIPFFNPDKDRDPEFWLFLFNVLAQGERFTRTLTRDAILELFDAIPKPEPEPKLALPEPEPYVDPEPQLPSTRELLEQLLQPTPPPMPPADGGTHGQSGLPQAATGIAKRGLG